MQTAKKQWTLDTANQTLREFAKLNTPLVVNFVA